MKKAKAINKIKKIDVFLLFLMLVGVLSLNLWLFWVAFWIFFFLKFKEIIKIFNKIELLI